MTKLEQVAQAIHYAEKGRYADPEFFRTPATGGKVYLDMARAALEAMWTPTPGMLAAGKWVFPEDGVRTFRAMVDSALEEGAKA